MSAQYKNYPNDLTLVEIYTVELHFGLDTCQIRSTPKVINENVTCQLLLLYSTKLWQEKTLVDLAVHCQSAKVLSTKKLRSREL